MFNANSANVNFNLPANVQLPALRGLTGPGGAMLNLPGLAELGISAEALEPVVASYLELEGRADPLLAMRQRYNRG